ncbi:hypothetical protein UFOVP1435_39 [uncultured Caudovirales phage]|uniref:Uncharacterized protein n=1 Tax=uncultured Caudovirales phage TaxID=2100421 RepID=A0A6J5SGD9_9CAUD|nr:hypothetical protein UFOVP1435_39 [uncultured Caudovirales phage]CAB5227985.1 hypothetical protein UFOVP1530_29 [uncultured Caudovirales phage]
MKPKAKPSGADNLIMAIAVLSVISIACALVTAYLIQQTLDAFQSSHAMVGLITDSGLVFDDKNTERQLSSATRALMNTRDISVALAFGSTFVIAGVIARSVKLPPRR